VSVSKPVGCVVVVVGMVVEVVGPVDVVDAVEVEVSGTVLVEVEVEVDVDVDVVGTVLVEVEVEVEVDVVVAGMVLVDVDVLGAVVDDEDEDDEEDDVVVAADPTGTVASVSVGMLHVTDVWIAPFRTTAVVSLNALNVTAPEAGACTSTVIVGVVSVPGTNGPGVPVMNSSLVVAMVPSTAVSGVFAGVCGAAVGTMVAVPGFTIDPGMNEPPPWTW